MSSNSNQGPLARKVLVELVLQRDERFVSGLIEIDVPKNSSANVGTYFAGLFFTLGHRITIVALMVPPFQQSESVSCRLEV